MIIEDLASHLIPQTSNDKHVLSGIGPAMEASGF